MAAPGQPPLRILYDGLPSFQENWKTSSSSQLLSQSLGRLDLNDDADPRRHPTGPLLTETVHSRVAVAVRPGMAAGGQIRAPRAHNSTKSYVTFNHGRQI